MKMSERYFKRVLVAFLCCLAIAYRYYSAFLAAKVAAFDETSAPNRSMVTLKWKLR